MPREKPAPRVLVTKIDYEWDREKDCSTRIPNTEPANVVLERWGSSIREVVDSALDCRDISMSELRSLETVASQIENAKEYL
tara:strand:- start:206 stop:451 length:246 start_codon:yes stop_codon:yes gene_type:complete